MKQLISCSAGSPSKVGGEPSVENQVIRANVCEPTEMVDSIPIFKPSVIVSFFPLGNPFDCDFCLLRLQAQLILEVWI